MAITHVLSDGRILADITGYVVKKEQVAGVYNLIDGINQRQSGKGVRNEEKEVEQDKS